MSWQSNAVYNFYSVLSLAYPTNEQKILQIFVIIVASISVGGLGFFNEEIVKNTTSRFVSNQIITTFSAY